MKIQLAQLILLALAILFVWYVVRARTVLVDRLILFVMAVGGIVLILFPEFSSTLANWIGIGRGADMVFYFFILFSLFRFVGISAEKREMQRKLTDVVRALAIQNARVGSPIDAGEGD